MQASKQASCLGPQIQIRIGCQAQEANEQEGPVQINRQKVQGNKQECIRSAPAD